MFLKFVFSTVFLIAGLACVIANLALEKNVEETLPT